eukprot:4621112-Prymnesium_polylepis.1
MQAFSQGRGTKCYVRNAPTCCVKRARPRAGEEPQASDPVRCVVLRPRRGVCSYESRVTCVCVTGRRDEARGRRRGTRRGRATDTAVCPR